MERPSPAISHLQLLIISYTFTSCTFQKKVIIYSVSSHVFTFFCLFLVFICFHPRVSLAVSLPTQGVHSQPATQHLFPRVAHLFSILPLAE